MTISGNISNTIYETHRAGLPASKINIQAGQLVTDGEIWPCGLVLGKNESNQYLPCDTVSTAVGTGDGSTTDFTDEVGGIEPGTAEITAGAITLTDDGCGNFTGTGGSGSINYETGAVSVNFSTAPANEAAVAMSYKPDPCAVLDAQTDTSKTSSALVVRFGAVRKADLKVGAIAQTAATSAIIRRLDIHHLYAI